MLRSLHSAGTSHVFLPHLVANLRLKMRWLRNRSPGGRRESIPVRDPSRPWLPLSPHGNRIAAGALAGGDSNALRRSAPLSSCWIQIPSSGAGQNDIGRDHDPKCVVADEGDLDEHPHDCKAHHYERKRKSKPHDTSPMRRNKSNKRFRDSRCKTRLHLRFAFARPQSLRRQDDSTREHFKRGEPCQSSNRQSVSGMAQHGST